MMIYKAPNHYHLGGDDEWKIGKTCHRGHLATAFQIDVENGDSGKDLDTAKADCAAACDARDDCKFAPLYWTQNKQTCYLSNENCGDFDDHWAYQTYVKE